jgi:hypothetical protein
LLRYICPIWCDVRIKSEQPGGAGFHRPPPNNKENHLEEHTQDELQTDADDVQMAENVMRFEGEYIEPMSKLQRVYDYPVQLITKRVDVTDQTRSALLPPQTKVVAMHDSIHDPTNELQTACR